MSESKELDPIAKHEPVTGKKCEHERYCYRLAEWTITSSSKKVCNFHHYLITAAASSTPAKK